MISERATGVLPLTRALQLPGARVTCARAAAGAVVHVKEEVFVYRDLVARN